MPGSARAKTRFQSARISVSSPERYSRIAICRGLTMAHGGLWGAGARERRLAGAHGNRTHRSRCSRNPTGFEGRAAHQHRSAPGLETMRRYAPGPRAGNGLGRAGGEEASRRSAGERVRKPARPAPHDELRPGRAPPSRRPAIPTLNGTPPARLAKSAGSGSRTLLPPRWTAPSRCTSARASASPPGFSMAATSWPPKRRRVMLAGRSSGRSRTSSRRRASAPRRMLRRRSSGASSTRCSRGRPGPRSQK